MSFTAHRQFASASGLEELKAVHVRLPSGSVGVKAWAFA